MIPFKSIRVGPFDVRITELTGEDRDKCQGTFYKSDMTISLQEKYANSQIEAETTIHELSHAMWEVAGITAKDGEERIVSMMSKMLAMVIRDNPKLIEWLQDKLS